jgi:RNA 3'-terminal phosphate cyclase-like protein
VDTTAQSLALTFMALGDRDVSKYLFGEPSLKTVHLLRDLQTFFEHKFKIDEISNIEDELLKKDAGAGSENKAIFTCLGIGYLNLNKGIL